MKFLDKDGLSTLWTKIKNTFLSLSGGKVNDSFKLEGKKIVVSTKSYTLTDQSTCMNIHSNMFIDGNIQIHGNTMFRPNPNNVNHTSMSILKDNVFIYDAARFQSTVKFGTKSNIQISVDPDGTGKIYRGQNNLYIGTDFDEGYTYLAGSLAGYDNINYQSPTEDGAIAWKLIENGTLELGSTGTNGLFYIYINGKKYTFNATKLLQQGLLIQA